MRQTLVFMRKTLISLTENFNFYFSGFSCQYQKKKKELIEEKLDTRL